jgi:acyl-CoA synthetase (AMP-forming)/AMP-acid ligase II
VSGAAYSAAVPGVSNKVSEAAHAVRVLARAGVLRPPRPDRLLRLAGAVRHWGPGLAGAFAAGAARYGSARAIVDEHGTVTFDELNVRTDALARALQARGVGPGSTVGILCRNSRYFFDATGALAKLGANALFLNTGFSGPQLRDVMTREAAVVLLHDDEYREIAAEAGITASIVAWNTGSTTDSIDTLIAAHRNGPALARPAAEGRTIILTSGTTGTPKGAMQSATSDTTAGIALLERLPYRARDTIVIAAPCFHAWGLTNSLLSLLLGNTMVLERFFAPETTLAAIARNRADVLAAVPVMLLRIAELPDTVRSRYDTSTLRFVPLSGSALPGDLATRFMDAYGDVLYNLYGSTEAGAVSVASPADLRAAPSTAGRPPRGTDVKLLADDGSEVARGETGRIFVRSPLAFDGYTDGHTKDFVDGFMQTGDTGHFDNAGRLFVDGRDDDMIISGGENVFPGEVEDVIATHPAVVEAAVIGVDDEEFGQRLKAFVVRRAGAALDEAELKAFVRENLARYKVPRDVVFVDALPRTTTGKVLRRNLAD